MSERLEKLRSWLESELDFSEYTLTPASSDASFRRYFRVTHDGESLIVMDAPPEKEDSRPFVTVDRLLFEAGLNVPEILDMDLEQGYLLLGDLGSTLYLDELDDATVERLYGDALGALAAIQACDPAGAGLPDYDRTLLLNEMGLFRDWLVGTHLGITLNAGQATMLASTFDRLADNALEQPQVLVHRDYHSRNLMVTGRNNPGILDFQDAVVGPVTYDLVSLLRDCYIEWPRPRVEDWALGYQAMAAGIFARLNHRDGKPGYLGDIPRTLGYVVEVAGRYPELAGLGEFTERQVLENLA